MRDPEEHRTFRPPTVPQERPSCPACGTVLQPSTKGRFERRCPCGLRLAFTLVEPGRLAVQGNGRGPHGLRRDRYTEGRRSA